MKLEIVILVLGLSTALGYLARTPVSNTRSFGRRFSSNPGVRWRVSPRYNFPTVVSRRDAESTTPDVTTEGATEDGPQPNLYSLVDSLLESVKNGITAENLGEAASKIEDAANNTVDSLGGEVARADIQREIDDAASEFDGAVAVSSLFDEPLNHEASKLDAALCLLHNLAEKAKQQEGSGEPSKATVAAVSMTARAIQNIVMDFVGIIALNTETSEAKDVDKRWKFYGDVVRDPFGRNSYRAGISHSWRRKRSTSAHSFTKRGKWGTFATGAVAGALVFGR